MKKLAVIAVVLLTGMLCANSQESSKPEPKRGETKAAEAAPATPRPLSYYRLDFAVNELEDGKKTNSRSYTALVEAPGRANLKVGSRLPVSEGHGGFSYIDVGLNFNQIHIEEKESMLLAFIEGDIASVAAPEQAGTNPPVLRQAHFRGDTVVAPGKSTVLFSLDDVNSKHRFQIELTATKLK
jgi:hypothetical protein